MKKKYRIVKRGDEFVVQMYNKGVQKIRWYFFSWWKPFYKWFDCDENGEPVSENELVKYHWSLETAVNAIKKWDEPEEIFYPEGWSADEVF